MGKEVKYTCDGCGKESNPIYKIDSRSIIMSNDGDEFKEHKLHSGYLCESCNYKYESMMKSLGFGFLQSKG